MSVSVPARPSTPSEQFVAFIVNQRTGTAMAMYHHQAMTTGAFQSGSQMATGWKRQRKQAATSAMAASMSPFFVRPQGWLDLSSK